VLRALLKAAMVGPTPGYNRPWHLVVLQDRQTLAQIPVLSPYAHMHDQPFTALLVCGDRDLSQDQGSWENHGDAAVQSILAEVRNMGLGAVSVHLSAESAKDFRGPLGIPEHVDPVALVIMRPPAETKDSNERLFEMRVHQGHW